MGSLNNFGSLWGIVAVPSFLAPGSEVITVVDIGLGCEYLIKEVVVGVHSRLGAFLCLFFIVIISVYNIR